MFIQENDSAFTELAFCDARRLGRIRMASSPLSEPPISDLGFDPILSMPPLPDFRNTVLKRTCPIKALLLDQSFSAGIGNYLAGPHNFVYILLTHAQLRLFPADSLPRSDEILYQARVHPEQRCNTLDASQTLTLHHQIVDVCRITVEANADDGKYPEHWLFHHRWVRSFLLAQRASHTGSTEQRKESKANDEIGCLASLPLPFPSWLILDFPQPSGEHATVKWITVGGRTSAYVVEVQKPFLKQKIRDEPPEVLSSVTLIDKLE